MIVIALEGKRTEGQKTSTATLGVDRKGDKVHVSEDILKGVKALFQRGTRRERGNAL